jgi:hypothetical protein
MRKFRTSFSRGRRAQGSLPVTLERFLGPIGEQVSCEECFAEIDRYVDLEAAGVDAAAAFPTMKTHLDGCPACREEHDDLLAFLTAK